jgi:energy-coupling factor transporter ATP-binding protein EcfA2
MACVVTRRVEDEGAWGDLERKFEGRAANPVVVEGVEIDVARPCTVIGGRNGAGKSRVLRSLATTLGDKALYLDLHHLCEQALIILRSREDFPEMIDEVDPVGPDDLRREDAERVLARNYDAIRWFSFEVEPDDEAVAERFRWGGTTPLIPYFEAEHRGASFSSREMGLGEFSVHFLFWILEQYRDSKGLTLLLDEPDAYLPPVGSSSLLLRLLQLCLKRDWSLVLTTHSTEMIERATDRGAFVLLRVDERGAVQAVHSKDEPGAADTLMTPPPVRNVLFVEDESAWMLCTVLMEFGDRRLPLVSSVIWGKGAGYMVTLQEHFPRSVASQFFYTYVFDGDQRAKVSKSNKGRWPALFLPTTSDPDQLFLTNGDNTNELAIRLNVPEQELKLFLDGKHGLDAHDWVNDLGDKYGRQKTLRVLAEMWVENHAPLADAWYRELVKALS